MTTNKILEIANRYAEERNLRHVHSKLNEVEYYNNYSEPGYSTDKPVILTGNWNDSSKWNEATQRYGNVEPDNTAWLRIVKMLEHVAELEWCNEWTRCDDCGGAVRTSGDWYGWTRAWHETEYGRICLDCAPNHASDIIDTYVNNPRTAMPAHSGIDLADHGFVRVDKEFENGFHPGQDADPKKIAKALVDRGIDRYVFSLGSVGQFDMRFSVWVDQDQAHLVNELPDSETDGPSVSGAMERGLREASLKMGELKGDGIRSATINADGTADVKLVSPQDFIEGKLK